MIKIEKNQDLSILIWRVLVAGLIIFHGIGNLRGEYTFIKGVMSQSGLPEFFAYGAFIGEIIAPIFIIIGYKVRTASTILALVMLIAIITAHANDIFALNQFGGWAIELQAFYLFGAISLVFSGAGKYTLVKQNLK